MTDLQIAQQARMKAIADIAAEAGIRDSELLPWGRNLSKVDPAVVAKRSSENPEAAQDARYVDVTAITPTPLGEGKTTTTVGLTQGLGRIGRKAMCAIRQPSMGPTFGIKGGAAGGGFSQVLPMEEFNLHLTGDLHAVGVAHNLVAAAIDSQLYHESRWSDSFFAKRGLTKLGIDPYAVHWKRVVDMNDRALRNVVLGLGDKSDGIVRESGYEITVASELMAILALATNLRDLRERIGRMVVASSENGSPVNAEDLGVAGAATVLLKDALWPNLLQTIEGQPAFVHTGPFANIAHGNSSVLADNVGLSLGGFVVTESGFGSDIGMEKFFDIKCRASGRMPDAVALVATVRALKMQGGGPAVRAGRSLPKEYTEEQLELLERGLDNLRAHIRIARLFGVPVVVALNAFDSDSTQEHERVIAAAREAGAYDAVVTRHHAEGGAGAEEFANAVTKAADEESRPDFLYDLDQTIEEKIETLATKVYGAERVEYSPEARARIEELSTSGYGDLPVCIAKTQLSISHDPSLKGAPSGYVFPIREIRANVGAGFLYALAGDIRTMPGLPSAAAYRGVDIDVESGRVTGLF